MVMNRVKFLPDVREEEAIEKPVMLIGCEKAKYLQAGSGVLKIVA